MPSLSQAAIPVSSPQFVYWTQHSVVWDIPLSSLGQLSRLPAVHLLTGRSWESQKSLIYSKLFSAPAKASVLSTLFLHKFKTGTMPAAKKKINSLPVETRTGTQGQAAASWGCPIRERSTLNLAPTGFGLNSDLLYSLLSLALLSVCLLSLPSDCISSKLAAITDQRMDPEREDVTPWDVRCSCHFIPSNQIWIQYLISCLQRACMLSLQTLKHVLR